MSAEYGEREDRILDPSQRVSEVLSLWKRMMKTQYLKHKLDRKGTQVSGTPQYFLRTYRLVFKVKYFFDQDMQDEAAVELWYIQAKRDLEDLRYLVTLQDVKVLVALQLQEENGDCPEHGVCCFVIDDGLDKYIPQLADFLLDVGTEMHAKLKVDIGKDITVMYKKLKGYTQLDARLTYLDFIGMIPVYGSQFFIVRTHNRKLPGEIVVAISKRGVTLFDMEENEILQRLYFEENFRSWSNAETNLQIVSDEGEKFVFQSDKEDIAFMCDLMTKYIDAIKERKQYEEKQIKKELKIHGTDSSDSQPLSLYAAKARQRVESESFDGGNHVKRAMTSLGIKSSSTSPQVGRSRTSSMVS